jgi:hypothetical protein
MMVPRSLKAPCRPRPCAARGRRRPGRARLCQAGDSRPGRGSPGRSPIGPCSGEQMMPPAWIHAGGPCPSDPAGSPGWWCSA